MTKDSTFVAIFDKIEVAHDTNLVHTKMTQYYINDTMALAAAHMAIIHYSMRGYLTSCYLDMECSSYDVTVHYRNKSKPVIPEFITPSSIKWDERVTLDGLEIKAVTLTYKVQNHE